jgi:hypothetical protein
MRIFSAISEYIDTMTESGEEVLRINLLAYPGTINYLRQEMRTTVIYANRMNSFMIGSTFVNIMMCKDSSDFSKLKVNYTFNSILQKP